MSIETKLADEFRNRGIKITVAAKQTDIPYSVLRQALRGRRQLRANEFLKLCAFLQVDPDDYRPSTAWNRGKGAEREDLERRC